MSALLTIFVAIIFCFAAAFLLAFGCIGIQFLLFFHWRKCKHCKHHLIYRGLREDDANGHYLFYCPKCGSWEQIPREKLFRQCDPPEENI